MNAEKFHLHEKTLMWNSVECRLLIKVHAVEWGVRILVESPVIAHLKKLSTGRAAPDESMLGGVKEIICHDERSKMASQQLFKYRTDGRTLGDCTVVRRISSGAFLVHRRDQTHLEQVRYIAFIVRALQDEIDRFA